MALAVMRRGVAPVALVAALVALTPVGAWGHGRSSSSSVWSFEPGPVTSARVSVRVRLADLQAAVPEAAGLTEDQIRVRPEATAAVEDYLRAHVALRSGDSVCSVRGPLARVPTPDASHLARSWRIRCSSPGPLVLHIDPFLEVAPGHFHLARVARSDGETLERIFGLERVRLALESSDRSPAAAGDRFGEYLGLGVEHIATGLDHLVFLLALLLAGASLWEVATIVTGFTVAHSVTLALGVLGVVVPMASAVEALIGLSIVVVALENFALYAGRETRRAIMFGLGIALAAAAGAATAGWVAVPALALVGVGLFALCDLGLQQRVARPGRLRWFVAFVFGLVHGFGFAGLLVEIGLPAGRLAPALFGFNLGVELGQLVIVAAAWPVLRVLLRRDAARRVPAFSAPILAAGLYWFLTRAV